MLFGSPTAETSSSSQSLRDDEFETDRALAEGVRGRLEWMRQLLPEDQREAASDDQIVGTLASMVGGVILARTVGGKDSAAVLDACREFLRRNAGQSGKRSTSSRTKHRRPPGTRTRVKRAGASRQR